MTLVPWIFLAFLIMIASVPITGGRRTVNEKALAKLARKQGLPIAPTLRQAVVDRVAARENASLRWGIGGLVTGVVVALILRFVTGTDALDAIYVMFSAALGLSIGSYRGVIATSRTPDPDAPRVARSRSTELSDYTTPPERFATSAVPAAVVLAVIGAMVIWWLAPLRPAGGMLVPAVMIAGGVVLISLIVLLARARSVVLDHPQRANNDLELAWDDALRTLAIRDLQDSAIASGLMGTFVVLVLAGSWVISPEARAGAEALTMNLGLLALAVGVICWALLLIPWGMGRARRNPSLQMWADHRFQEA